MKQVIFLLGLFLVITNSRLTAQSVAEPIKKRGAISPDSENVNNESDPRYLSAPVNPAVFKKAAEAANQTPVSQLEYGMDIVSDIVKKFISPEYGFSLLSSHKYMVNDCLGIKVSSGQFTLRFSNPLIQLTNSGQIKIRLEVDKIKFSALKIRMKPRAPDLSDPNPCHFSGKFEIGGEATDLSVTVIFSLATSGLEGSAGFCYFAFDNTFSIKWNIGGLNLRPSPNTLDNVLKEMVEDALNTGLDNIFFTTFIQLSKEVIPQYYSACQNIYSAEKVTNTVSGAMTNENNSAQSAQSKPGIDDAKWTITPNQLKGITGRLDFSSFPKDADWQIDIYSEPTNNFIKTLYSSSSKESHFTLSPGNYTINYSRTPVINVPIKTGHDTYLKFGILDIVSEGQWGLYDATGKIYYKHEYKPMKIILPVGTYILKLGGADHQITIKDGKTVEM